MNETIVRNHVNLFCALLAVATLSARPVCQAQTAKKATPTPPRTAASTNSVIPKSVFVVPQNPQEGRDPFFPNSMRAYGVDEKPHATTTLSNLVLKALLGTPDHRLAQINDRTFEVGETRDVSTPEGLKTIRCVEIRSDSVVIESGGVRQELHMRPDF